jgi:hypothetical protein
LTAGNSNIFVGGDSPNSATTGNYNIYIGTNGGLNSMNESNTMRIGDATHQTKTYVAGINGSNISGGAVVFVDANGMLGINGSISSSQVSGNISASQVIGSLVSATIPGAQVTGSITGLQVSGNISASQIVGSLSSATIGGSQITGAIAAQGDVTLSAGNVNLPISGAASRGNVLKNGAPFIHNYGTENTFIGVNAGNFTLSGTFNTASGSGALKLNAAGSNNIAIGATALGANTSGNGNTAIGGGALGANSTGGGNIAIGYEAGFNHTVGDNSNMDIGTLGVSGDSNTIRIGDPAVYGRAFIAGIYGATSASGSPVYINSSGQLGTVTSSARFKDNIADMEDASAKLMQLRPVTFVYKPQFDDGSQLKQYGLVAEEVEKVDPGLVARSADGEVQTVRYQFLAPMLLNEYQKQQRTIEAQAADLAKQTARIAELEQDRAKQVARIDTLETQALEIAALKQQAAKLAAILERLGYAEVAGR